MRINYTFLILLLIGLFNSAIAGTFESIQPQKSQSACSKVAEQSIVYPGSYPYDVYQYPFFYVNAGAGVYHLKNPTVGVGNITDATNPVASINNSGRTAIYNVNFGYAFYNPHNSIFGHFNDVALKFSYLDISDTKQSNLGGTAGDLWYIDGSGTVSVFGSVPLQQSLLKAKHQLIDTGLYYRSVPSVACLSKITMHPRLGVIFTDFNAKYNVFVSYHTGTGLKNDTEQYKVKTYYYGVAAGEQLAFHIMPQFLLLGDAELQLLHATSDLDASQLGINTDPATARKVDASLNKDITYRVIAYLGAKFYFLPKANSVSFGIKAGIDHWGYNPQVITPNTAGGGKCIHLVGTSQNNPFVLFDVTIPFG